MTVSTTPATLDLDAVRRTVSGQVFGPADAGYDRERQVMYGDLHPAAVIRAADISDVQKIIRLAADTGLELAVRSGGHSGAGHGSTEGGIVLDLRDINGDRHRRRGAHGLGRDRPHRGRVHARRPASTASPSASATPVRSGIGGITLGGGVGYLARKHGLTIDNLLAADVVTADGEVLRRRRRARPGPVLGDPRRRRQLRRRDPVPVPAP